MAPRRNEVREVRIKMERRVGVELRPDEGAVSRGIVGGGGKKMRREDDERADWGG